MHLADGRRLLGRSEEAIENLKRSVELRPDFLAGLVWLASTDGNLGRQAEAEAAAAEVSRLNPAFSISAYGGKVPYRDEAVLEQFREGLAPPACRRTLSLRCGVDFVEESALRTESLRLSLVSSAQRAGQAPLPPKSAAIPQGRGRFPYCRQPRRERKVLTCPAGGSMVLRWFAAAIMLAAALCARAAGRRDPDWRGRSDDRRLRLVRRAVSARHRTRGRGSQRRRRRARPAASS